VLKLRPGFQRYAEMDRIVGSGISGLKWVISFFGPVNLQPGKMVK
jgi:hypothetical protein